MPVDPSIALQGQPVQLPNPLQQAMMAAGLRNQTLQGNNLQRTIASNQAISQAIQKNTDANGNVNLSGVQSDLSRNPDAAYNLQEATGTNLQQQNQQTQNATSKFQLQKAHYDNLVQQTASLIADPDINRDKVITMIGQTAADFGVPDEMVRQAVAGIPNTSDKGQLKTFLTQKLLTAQNSANQLEQSTPGGATVNTGPSQAIINTRPGAGVPIGAPVAQYKMGLTPGEATAPTSVGVNANGIPQVGTRQQFIDQTQGGGVQTSPSSFQTGEQNAAAQYENDLNGRARAANQSAHYISEAQDIMGNAAQTGGGATFRADLARRAQAIGLPDSIVDSISKGNLADTQVLGKVLMQNAIQQMQANFSGTGAAANVEQFLKNNPNLENDPRAIPKLFNFMSGLNGNVSKEQQAYRGFVNRGGNPVDFPAQWNNSTTMRAFTGQIRPVKTGTTKDGRKVVQYSDGSVDYQ